MLEPQVIIDALKTMALDYWILYPDTGRVESFDAFASLSYGQNPSTQDELYQFLHPEDANSVRKAVADYLNGSQNKLDIEVRIKTARGDYVWRWWMGAIIPGNPNRRLLVFSRDIHSRRIKEEKLHQLAATDPLTGAYNRSMGMLLMERVRSNCAQEGRSIGAIVVELPNIKPLNEKHGISAGNSLIQTLARIIRENIRPLDLFSRLEGVSFLVCCSSVTKADLELLINKIEVKVQEFNVRENTKDYALAFRWGIADNHNPSTENSESLIQRARQDLYVRSRSRV